VKGAAIEVLDDRLRTKEYGKRVAKYLEGLIGGQIIHQSGSTEPREMEIATQKKKAQRKEDGQMKLL
jgi:hypothetical protein